MQKIRTIPLTVIPFALIHLACLLAFVPAIWEHTTAKTLWLALACFVIRKFGITGGYHRYFSHRTFKTSRFFQFVLAFLGGAAAQKGALWWAAHHRHHHKYSDQDDDVHSPARDGVWWSHVGWVLSPQFNATRVELIKDMWKFPELRFLNNYHLVPIFVLGAVCLAIDGWAGVIWGTFISTVFLYHTTFAINSFCHMLGRRRFPTTDDSKNSLILALLTMGEGWHNNHHYYQNSVNQGFYWWQIDLTYYILRMLSVFGVVWDLRMPPQKVLALGRNPGRVAEMMDQLKFSATSAAGRTREAALAAAHAAQNAAANAAHAAGETATAAAQAAGEAAAKVAAAAMPNPHVQA